MSVVRLAWKNAVNNGFRSLAVFLCAALVAGLALTATFVVRGAEASLRSNLDRLGADLLVLPWGTMTDRIDGVRLMSAAIEGWMPPTMMEKVEAVPGVETVSPQLYLTTLEDSPYSPYPQMYLVAYDPETDFTLEPWLDGELEAGLRRGEAIAGAHITTPAADNTLLVYDQPLTVVERLARTETTIDNTLFVNYETADQLIAASAGSGDRLEAIPGTISAIMVRVDLDADPGDVALRMMTDVSGVVPLETTGLFQTERRQLVGVLRTLLGVLGSIWLLAIAFMALVFSLAVNERRFEIGVLRGIGFPSRTVLNTLLLEGATLALAGGLAGVVLTVFGLVVFGDEVVQQAGLPFEVPSAVGLFGLALAGQVMALVSVLLAALVPAWRISHEEVALTMRD